MRFLTRSKTSAKKPAKSRKPAARPARRQTRTAASRRPLRRDLAVLLRRFAVAGVVLAVLAGGYGLVAGWRSGVPAAFVTSVGEDLLQLTADAGLKVRDIGVVGRSETEPDAILAALGTGRWEPILGLDPWAAQTRLEQLPWVETARVYRRFPDSVLVQIVERRPMALWQRHGELHVIDRRAQVIVTDDAERFAGLPLVVSDKPPTDVAGVLRAVGAERELARRIVAYVKVSGRRWNLTLDDGTTVKLPENGMASAWRRFAAMQREHDLLARDVRTIDLRNGDGIAVRLPTPPVQVVAPGPGEST